MIEAEARGDILILEDEAAVRTSICQVLALEGYRGIEAENADQAFRILDSQPWTWQPVAIIVDLILPGSSGFDAIRRFHEKYGGKPIPIIVVTRLSTSEDVVEAEIAGAHVFIRKPFTGKKLLSGLNFGLENLAKPHEDRDTRIHFIK